MKKLYFLAFTLITSMSFAQVINEVDADTPGTDAAEFVEILHTPNTALDGLVVVFYNGSSDTSYQAFDLDGKTTDANGFFIIANTALATGTDIDMGGSNVLQNGADAVAIYTGNDTDFPTGTAVTAANLLSGVVYDTADADDTGLLAVIGGLQYDERENALSDTQSIQRKTDGTYEVKNITFRADNNAATCDLSLTTVNAVCDAITAGTDTYTATIDFVGGMTSTYTISTGGVGTIGGDDPSTMATGTITVTGVNELTDFTLTVVDGGICNLSSPVTGPACVPSLPLPLYEGFDYAAGTNLIDSADWENISTSSDEVLVAAGNLSYTGMPASTGGLTTFDGTGSDPAIEFDAVTAGEVFTSFMFKVTDQSAITDVTDGGYFAVMGGFAARLWVHPNPDAAGTTYDIGVSDGGSGPVFTPTTYNVGDTVFAVMSYNIDTGVINVWINPATADLGGTAPAAVTITDTDTSINADISQFVIRQDSGGETPFMEFDELRIGTTWDAVTTSTLSVAEDSNNTFNMYPNPTSLGYVNILSTNNEQVNVAVFDLLGKQVANQKVVNNELNVASLKAGIYILKLEQEGKISVRKLVVQ